MKKKYILGLAAAIALVSVALVSVESKKIEYMGFVKAKESGKRAQIAGKWLKSEGCSYDSKANTFNFKMTDNEGKVMSVVLDGAKPNNFELAESVVATGEVTNYAGSECFRATNVLTKCPSKYEADKFTTE